MVFSSAADSESESLPCEIREHSTSDSGKSKINRYQLNENLILNTRGKRSAKKFRKIANPQICGLTKFVILKTFRKCGNLRICDLRRDFLK
jgi:hypothetical protein